MRVSPSSSVQRARQALAGRLREIRLDAGLKARDLAAHAGWHRTKVSHIERAARSPSVADIQTWCRLCNAAGQEADLIAALRMVEDAYVEWRRLERSGLRRVQEQRVPLIQQAESVRVYQSQVVPGLLQTPEYASHLLRMISTHHQTPDDVADAVAARIERQRLLAEGRQRFAFLLEEAVLRSTIGDADVMAAQLGHLLSAPALPAVALGVIPQGASRPMWTLEGFWIYDDMRVDVELLSAQVTIKAPGEIALYVSAFEKLAEAAVYGAKARALIASAIADLD